MKKNEVKEIVVESTKLLFKIAWLIILVVGMIIMFTR